VGTRPRPEDYPTRARHRWALRNWTRSHGGSLLGTLAIAVVIGALSGSAMVLVLLVAFALVATAYASSRP
jgi:hypothetical protein